MHTAEELTDANRKTALEKLVFKIVGAYFGANTANVGITQAVQASQTRNQAIANLLYGSLLFIVFAGSGFFDWFSGRIERMGLASVIEGHANGKKLDVILATPLVLGAGIMFTIAYQQYPSGENNYLTGFAIAVLTLANYLSVGTSTNIPGQVERMIRRATIARFPTFARNAVPRALSEHTEEARPYPDHEPTNNETAVPTISIDSSLLSPRRQAHITIPAVPASRLSPSPTS